MRAYWFSKADYISCCPDGESAMLFQAVSLRAHSAFSALGASETGTIRARTVKEAVAIHSRLTDARLLAHCMSEVEAFRLWDAADMREWEEDLRAWTPCLESA
jgi:hypothetical protein